MSDEQPDGFPVPEPETKPKSAIWTPEKRAAFGAKMKAAKAAKREEQARS